MNLFQLLIANKARKLGLSLHAHIICAGLFADLHLATKLLIFYGKLCDVSNARKVFDRIPERNIITWTAQISCYTHNGYYQDALAVLLDMRRFGVKPNQFTYGSLLRACIGLKCLGRGLQIQACAQKSRFADNVVVQSALVDLHSKCGKMDDALSLFQTMSRKDVVAWNAMIGGYGFQGLSNQSFQMLRLMMRQGLIPDCFTLGSVLKVSSRARCLSKVGQIHGYAITLGFGSHATLTGSLIDAYAKCESMRNACYLYNIMGKKDVVSFTALMTGYAQDSSNSTEALYLLKEIRQMHFGIDDVLLCSMFNICASLASVSIGRQLHAFAVKRKYCHDVAMCNALIDMYAKSGEIHDAAHAFGEMKEKNVISWTSLIAGYGRHGYGNEAIMLYKKMELEGLKPNDITFLSLLFACSHVGLIDEGLECFNSMISKYGIKPRAEHLSCIVDLYARRGHLEEAYNMVCSMNIKPSASLWCAILGSCSTYGHRFLGEVAATHLFSMDPENSVNYVVLAGVYAGAGSWNSAWEVRNLLTVRKLKKAPAYSYLHSTKGKVRKAFLKITLHPC
ncbi:hypothetical protein K2173_024648 [Erythroxylum novogranatense]|uniref:Pentatricopeptide repeat-containing protein n=1 Tax=Erythroxylum novogranatense TaxID=1862640 RepID=A0AAV8SUY5_9ROSI|nr:hypothetical protein K2173_024648 [Erythroxylum novogranatense]